ncbi:AraC family transcriptional regulator [Paenibacillus sp. SSG-1]|uniref:AraC family transcriptional regulator n=1 Tax=Paenibacillus cineris TaxID=237530 RepID=A0ABQ4LC63_9BACL|nr:MULTISPECIES: AraC family transcriptional regulator [Paenibacillus]OXL83699.1 AraC family transcriptional regulator [Paenibacillus sp. SSG-1]UYO02772.1 AraC family transcriptional regulator [Paenibacillus sp. PSB04]GIO54158.1 AraC family transcriptional regulator [Paenibacillus cineris]
MDREMQPNGLEPYLSELSGRLNQLLQTDGLHITEIPSLHMMRATATSEPIHSMYAPSLCFIVQGAKSAALGQEIYHYNPTTYLVTSVHLPIKSEITEASPEVPFIGLHLEFTPDQILDILQHTDLAWPEESEPGSGIFVGKTNSQLLDALLRLVKLFDQPAEIPILAPLITREILFRVLQGEQGHLVKQFAVIGSQAHAIAKAIQLIHRDYSKPLRVEELAKEVNMAASSFHKHFKQVTALSPLQYQKRIRLQEARHLMISEKMGAADAAFQVGYESPSQFSREYARLYGLPPKSDLKQASIQ